MLQLFIIVCIRYLLNILVCMQTLDTFDCQPQITVYSMQDICWYYLRQVTCTVKNARNLQSICNILSTTTYAYCFCFSIVYCVGQYCAFV